MTTQLYWTGTLPADLAERTRIANEAAPVRLFRADDVTEDAIGTPLDEATVAELNRAHTYHDIPMDAAGEVIAALKGEVRDALGGPWCVLNVRCWTTESQAKEFGPNAWHVDGMPLNILKIMVYLTETGLLEGGLAINLGDNAVAVMTGPPGKWILFHNSVLQHCGIAPTIPGWRRVAMELTVMRSRDFDLSPRFLGLNGRHPGGV